MAFIKYIGSDYPESKIPDEFQSLLNIGKKTAEVQVFGYIWVLATLEEWEQRIIARAHSNLDALAKAQLRRIDVLNQSIIKLKNPTTQEEWSFTKPSEKLILRSLLLLLDSKVIDVLYQAYILLENQSREEFNKQYSNIIEEIANQILGQQLETISTSEQKRDESSSDTQSNTREED